MFLWRVWYWLEGAGLFQCSVFLVGPGALYKPMNTEYPASGGTLAVFLPTKAGLVVAGDKRQSPQGIFCDGINKILVPNGMPSTAVVITGYISLQDTSKTPSQNCANTLRKHQHRSILAERH